MQPSSWLYDFLRTGAGSTWGGERFRPTAYNDGRGVWTIGYGHTASVKEGDTCTMVQAVEWLHQDTVNAVVAVNRLVKVPLTQNQFDALVSLVFNCGPDPLNKALGSMLNAGDYKGAADQFLLWKNAGKMRGVLLPRRQIERNRFLSA